MGCEASIDVRLASIYDENPERGFEKEKEVNAKYFDDLEIFLEQDDLDTVVICSMNCKLYAHATTAVEGGKDMLLRNLLQQELRMAE